MITHIATTAVYVSDQEAALKFWTEQVGFKVRQKVPMGPQGYWLEVCPEGARSAVVLYPRSMMADWAERKPSIVFECDDVRKTYEEMSARGVKFVQEPKTMSWGTFAIFQDPDGNEFVLKGNGEAK